MLGRTVEILIDGKEEPNPALIARARELVADFNTFERRLNDYLAQTAKEWASEAPELGADISTLRISSIKLRSREPVLVDFDGPDVDVYWSCEYADGNFSGLDLIHSKSRRIASDEKKPSEGHWLNSHWLIDRLTQSLLKRADSY